MQRLSGVFRLWMMGLLVGWFLTGCLGQPISKVGFPCATTADCGGGSLVCDATNLCVDAPDCKDQGKSCEFKNSSGDGLGAGSISICESKKLVCLPGNEITIFADQKSFKIGSPTSDKQRQDDENQVTVTFDYNFTLGRREVTQKEFRDLMGYSPSKISGDQMPVTNVSWHEAALFANKLSERDGLKKCFACSGDTNAKPYNGTCTVAGEFSNESDYVQGCDGYRLPTESEWEFAYKAQVGAYRSFYNGDSNATADKCEKDDKLEQIAHYCNNAQSPQPVGSKEGNRWMLQDLSGNVSEWVFDWYNAVYVGPLQNRMGPRSSTGSRVHRGGSFQSNPKDCRGAARFKDAPDKRLNTLGFRLARTLLDK